MDWVLNQCRLRSGSALSIPLPPHPVPTPMGKTHPTSLPLVPSSFSSHWAPTIRQAPQLALGHTVMRNTWSLPLGSLLAVKVLLLLEPGLAPYIPNWMISGTSVFPSETGAQKSLSAQAVMRIKRHERGTGALSQGRAVQGSGGSLMKRGVNSVQAALPVKT